MASALVRTCATASRGISPAGRSDVPGDEWSSAADRSVVRGADVTGSFPVSGTGRSASAGPVRGATASRPGLPCSRSTGASSCCWAARGWTAGDWTAGDWAAVDWAAGDWVPS
ncbi:hypothetical protein GCM10018963_64770 [Saccharothrix longispora]